MWSGVDGGCDSLERGSSTQLHCQPQMHAIPVPYRVLAPGFCVCTNESNFDSSQQHSSTFQFLMFLLYFLTLYLSPATMGRLTIANFMPAETRQYRESSLQLLPCFCLLKTITLIYTCTYKRGRLIPAAQASRFLYSVVCLPVGCLLPGLACAYVSQFAVSTPAVFLRAGSCRIRRPSSCLCPFPFHKHSCCLA